jgi:phosphatidylglycerol:prolipoprotein diacylglycerol transferase
MAMAKRRHPAGRVFGAFLVLAGVERFLVEFVRAKDDRFLGEFTIAQLISVILIVIGIVLYVMRGRRPMVTAMPEASHS